MKYFKSIKSLEDLKSQYKDLLKINHPDNGGEVEKMQEINVQYDAFFKIWKDRHEEKTGEQVTETAESTRSQFYTEFGWKGSRYDSNLSTKDISARVRAYVKEKYPSCKFSVRVSGVNKLAVSLKEFPGKMYKTREDLEKEGLTEHIKTTAYDGEQLEFNQYKKEIEEMMRTLRRNGLFNLDYWYDADLLAAYDEAVKKNPCYAIRTEYFQSVIDDVEAFVKSYNYDDSDAMIDYFNTNFYFFGVEVEDCKQIENPARYKKKGASASKKAEITPKEETPQTEPAETPEENVNNYTYVILEDTDTRTNEKIYLVKVKESLSREEYIQINKYIKSLGGYYSQFKHGFIFKNNPEKKLCIDVTAERPEENTQETTAGTTKESKKETVNYIIIEDTHTKTGKKIWVAKPGKKLNRTDFAEVKQKLATLQGFYSTLKKGFVFTYNPEEILRTG